MTDLAQLGLSVDDDGFVRAEKSMRRYTKAAGGAETATQRLERRSKRMNNELQRQARMLGRLTGVVTALATAYSVQAVRAATQFESSIAQLNTLVGISRNELEGYSQAVLNMAKDVGRGPRELASALFAITSAGNRGAVALDLLESSARASALGLGDTRAIALAAGAAVTAYGQANLTASDAVDILIGTVEQGNLRAEQLAGVIGRVVSLANAAGASFADAGAFIASFTRQGVDAAQAVTGLRGTLQILVREPTAQTTEAFDEMGMSFEQFKQDVRDDGFITTFQKLVDRAQETGVEIGRIIPEMEGLTGTLAVFASEGESAESILNSVNDSVGTLTERFQTAVEIDPALGFALVRAEVEALQVRLGQDLLPVVTTLIGALTDSSGGASMLSRTLISLSQIILTVAQYALIMTNGFVTFGKIIGLTVAQLNNFGKSMRDNFTLGDLVRPFGLITSSVDSFKDAMSGSEAAREAFEEDIEQQENALLGLAKQLDTSADELGKLKKQMEENNTSTDGLETKTGTLGNTLSELPPTVRAVVDELELAVDTQEDWQTRIEDLRAELDGPAAQALLQYERDIESAMGAFARGEMSMMQFAEWLSLINEQLAITGRALQQELIDKMRELGQQASFMGGGGGGGGASNPFGFIGNIGNNFAQSIINGQGIQDSLSSAFTSFGAQGLSDTASTFFEDATSGGLTAAFENSKTTKGMAAGFSMAIGQAMEGNYVQAAFTAAGTAIAGPIGGMIGSLIGSLFGGESKPKFQVFGSQGQMDLGVDETRTTALGQINFAFREIDAEAERTVLDGFERLDSGIASAVRDMSVLSDMSDALRDFGVSSRSDGEDLENLMRMRLSAALEALPAALGDAVEELGISIDEQVQALTDIFTINRQLLSGITLGLAPLSGGALPAPLPPGSGGGGGGGVDPGGRLPPRDDFDQAPYSSSALREFQAVLTDTTSTVDQVTEAASGLHPDLERTVNVLMAVRVGNEPLIETFNRTIAVLETMDRQVALLGANFGQTREQMIEFGAGLLSFFGDDAGVLNSALERIAQALYSPLEIAEADAQVASDRLRSTLGGLLDELGITFTESMLTADGFRQLYEELMRSGELTDAQTARLIQAGLAIADLIEAEDELTNARQESTRDIEADLATVNDFLSAGLTAIDPLRARHLELVQAYLAARQAASGLKDEESLLFSARQSFNAQLAVLTNQLTTSIQSLNQQLFGSQSATQQVAQTTNQAASAANNFRDQWLNAIDAIEDALNNQRFNNSSLTREERVIESEQQLMQAIAAAQGGDLSAAQNLPALFQQAIGEGATFFGTATDEFAEFEARMRAALEGADLPVPPESPDVQTAANTQQIAQTAIENQLTALQELQAASALISQMETLSRITGQTPAEIGHEFGVPLGELMGILTGTVPDANADALDQQFNELATNIGEELNELSALEQNTLNMLDELKLLNTLFGQFMESFPDQFAGPAPEPPGFASGGLVGLRGPETIVAGEQGPEAILNAQVTRSLQRVGIPVNAPARSAAVEARLERVEAAIMLVYSSSQENVRAVERTGAEGNEELRAISRSQRDPRSQSQPRLAKS